MESGVVDRGADDGAVTRRDDETAQEWADREPEAFRQWADRHLAPRAEGAGRRLWRHLVYALARVALLVIIVAAALWWFTIYDTPRGKCERGDLGACVVWQAQSQPSP